MDYEKKYKEANDKVAIRFGTNVAKEIFTDLYESEDERIRKELIAFLKTYDTFITNRYISWLEKQSEQKPTLPKWKYKKDNTTLLKDSLVLNKCGHMAKLSSGAIVSDVWVIDYDELAKLPKEELEEQGEQKLAEWSEEDETGLTNTIIMLKEGASLHFNKKDITKAVNWIKSLKQKIKEE